MCGVMVAARSTRRRHALMVKVKKSCFSVDFHGTKGNRVVLGYKTSMKTRYSAIKTTLLPRRGAENVMAESTSWRELGRREEALKMSQCRHEKEAQDGELPPML